MTNSTIFYVNELGISVPAYDNYLQAIGIYKKLIADVFVVISILLLPAGQKATGKKAHPYIIYRVVQGNYIIFMQLYKNHGNTKNTL